MVQRPDIAEALAHVARHINQTRSLESTLDTIVDTAVRSLEGMDHVGITIAYRDGRMATRAASDRLVTVLDQLQYDLGEGPCVHAIHHEPVTRIEHAVHEVRWPRFIPAAVGHGLRSQLGLRLYAERETLGSLNMYSTTVDVIDPDVQHMAELFAAHASIALGRARRDEDLTAALLTRKVIGQAIGILMERYDLDEDRAFAYLTRVSSRSNVKLRDVAKEIVDQRNDATRRPT
jgi:GAF domain-containing protein